MSQSNPCQVDAVPLLKNPDPSDAYRHYCVHARWPTEGGALEERRWGAFIQKERAEEIAAKVRKALEGRGSCSVDEMDARVLAAIGP